MSKKLVTGIIVAIAAAIYFFRRSIAEMDIGWGFVIFLFGGLVLALLLVKTFLPSIGDSISAFILSGGGKMTADEMAAAGTAPKVVAMIARGDFKGALKEYEMTLHKNPRDLHAMVEISKIHTDNLEQPELAVEFLKSQISERTWTVDEEAFILFRIADIHRHAQHDRQRSEDVLEQIQARFPKTRHSANAREKLDKWHQEDAREDLVQRRRAEQVQ